MTNERHEKALEAAYAAAMVFKGSNPRDEMATVIAAYLQAMDAVIVPREAEFDKTLNDLGWDMNKFLQEGGADFGGRVFNNMKAFLKTAIEKWVSQAPNHFTNGE
jgi:hypothetical protein